MSSTSFAVLLEALSCPIRCELTAWDSSTIILTDVVDIGEQTIVHFNNIETPVQLILSNCKAIVIDSAFQSAYEAFPREIMVTSGDIEKSMIIKHVVFFKQLPLLSVDKFSVVDVACMFVCTILVIAAIFMTFEYISYQDPKYTQDQLDISSKNMAQTVKSVPQRSSGQYQPPHRLASTMTDEDKQLLSLAFSVLTTPEQIDDHSSDDSGSISLSSQVSLFCPDQVSPEMLEAYDLFSRRRIFMDDESSDNDPLYYSEKRWPIRVQELTNWEPVSAALEASVITLEDICSCYQVFDHHAKTDGTGNDEEVSEPAIINLFVSVSFKEFVLGSQKLQRKIDENYTDCVSPEKRNSWGDGKFASSDSTDQEEVLLLDSCKNSNITATEEEILKLNTTNDENTNINENILSSLSSSPPQKYVQTICT